VEQVSWQYADKFIKKINTLVPGLAVRCPLKHNGNMAAGQGQKLRFFLAKQSLRNRLTMTAVVPITTVKGVSIEEKPCQ
jgi:hypothetical protein